MVSLKEVKLLPVIPVVTVVTSNHRAAVIRFVASGTNPDLVSPFIPDLPHKRQTGLGGRFTTTKQLAHGSIRSMQSVAEAAGEQRSCGNLPHRC